MKTRIISGFIFALIFVGITFLPDIYIDFFFLLIILLAGYELINAFNSGKYELSKKILFLNLLTVFTFMQFEFESYLSFMIAILTILVYSIFKKNITLKNIGGQVFVMAYLSFLLMPIILLNNQKFIWLLYLLTWLTDTFAYFFGVKFGKHKLCERLSPKKSIEGAVAGSVFATIFAVLFCFLMSWEITIFSICLFLIATILGQLGDLMASLIKRQLNIKDYGNLIPGHGGIMDRMDSMFFVIPIVYIFMLYLV